MHLLYVFFLSSNSKENLSFWKYYKCFLNESLNYCYHDQVKADWTSVTAYILMHDIRMICRWSANIWIWLSFYAVERNHPIDHWRLVSFTVPSIIKRHHICVHITCLWHQGAWPSLLVQRSKVSKGWICQALLFSLPVRESFTGSIMPLCPCPNDPCRLIQIL